MLTRKQSPTSNHLKQQGDLGFPSLHCLSVKTITRSNRSESLCGTPLKLYESQVLAMPLPASAYPCLPYWKDTTIHPVPCSLQPWIPELMGGSLLSSSRDVCVVSSNSRYSWSVSVHTMSSRFKHKREGRRSEGNTTQGSSLVLQLQKTIGFKNAV